MWGPVQMAQSIRGAQTECGHTLCRYGVRSGMFISRAKELCPQLIVVPYDFEAYDAATEQVYELVARLLRLNLAVEPC